MPSNPPSCPVRNRIFTAVDDRLLCACTDSPPHRRKCAGSRSIWPSRTYGLCAAPGWAWHNPQDLARTRWTDWYASALDGYHLLRQQCDQIFVGGLSMGALLALLLSAEVPVDGVIAMATPLVTLSGPQRINLLRAAKYILPYTDQSDKSDLPLRVRDEQIQRGENPVGRVRYDRWSTAAYEQLLRLRQTVVNRLPDVTAPLLLIFSEKDSLIGLESETIIRQRVRSQTIETHVLKESGHILTQDIEHVKVFQLAADFIVRQGKNSG